MKPGSTIVLFTFLGLLFIYFLIAFNTVFFSSPQNTEQLLPYNLFLLGMLILESIIIFIVVQFYNKSIRRLHIVIVLVLGALPIYFMMLVIDGLAQHSV